MGQSFGFSIRAQIISSISGNIGKSVKSLRQVAEGELYLPENNERTPNLLSLNASIEVARVKESLHLQVDAAGTLTVQADRLKENMLILEKAVQTFKV